MIRTLLFHHYSPVALFGEWTDVSLLVGDVCAEDSAPVDLNRRVDDFCVIESITPRELFDFNLEFGRIFFESII